MQIYNAYRYIIRQRFLTAVFLTCILFYITYLIFDFHYGWIDDVIQNNYLRGIGLATPAKQMFTNQVLVSRLYYKLYSAVPYIPWYGYFALSYLFIATVQLIYLSSRLFKRFYQNNFFFFILYAIAFYFIIWIDFVVLVTFTKTSIILVGTSILLLGNLMESEQASLKKYLLVFSCIFTLLLGFLNRLEVVFLLTIPFVFYYWQPKNKNSYKTIGILLLTGVLSLWIYKIQTSGDIQKSVQKISHIQNVTDGKNVYDGSFGELIQKDFRYKSVWLYYWPDSVIISDSLLSKWGADKPNSINNLRNIPLKLKYEIKRAKYGYVDEYSKYSNWWNGFLLGLAINLIFGLFLYSKYRKKRPRLVLNHTMFLLSFSGILITILLFYKLEARLAIPSVAIVTLVSLATISKIETNILRHQKKWILAFILFPVFLFQSDKYISITNDRKNEETLKRNLIAEINHQFHDKVLYFDIWTLTLLHTTLLENVELNPSNRYVTYFESWSNFVPGNKEALSTICPVSDFVSFYNCVYNDKDKFIFVMTKDLRLGHIEEYAQRMHSYHMKFTEIKQDSEIKKIHYSLLPGRYDFGFYEIDVFEYQP